jgi:hypothetical protein
MAILQKIDEFKINQLRGVLLYILQTASKVALGLFKAIVAVGCIISDVFIDV